MKEEDEIKIVEDDDPEVMQDYKEVGNKAFTEILEKLI